MDWSDLFAALALYLVLRLMQALSSLQDRQLRLFGLASMSAGIALLYLVRS